MTLTGCVLPIGVVKEKVLAARRSGVRVVMFPEGNRPEYEDLAEELKQVGGGGGRNAVPGGAVRSCQCTGWDERAVIPLQGRDPWPTARLLVRGRGGGEREA